jgi:hypothetical protein
VSDDINYFEAQAKVAEALGMSRSIIKQMRQGEYTFDQIETLLHQRRHVLEVIRKAEPHSARSTPSNITSTPRTQVPAENIIASVGTTAPAVQRSQAEQLPMTPAGTPYNTPAESTTTTPTKRKIKKLTCNYQVCHACRPFLQDRLPMSFEPVLNNEVSAVTESEIASLPILEPNIVGNLGLRESPKPAPKRPLISIPSHNFRQGDAQEDDSEDWTPSSATSSAFYRDDVDDVDLYPCPGFGICPVADESGHCAYDTNFLDGKRAYHHGFVYSPEVDATNYNHLRHTRSNFLNTPSGTSSAGSSISLPESKTEPLTPTSSQQGLFNHTLGNNTGEHARAATALGIIGLSKDGKGSRSVSGESSGSSVGSEVEVEGGVALTEEAVGSGVPDIATEE